MFVKHYAPKSVFLSQMFVQMEKSAQNKLHKCLKKKFIFEIVTYTFFTPVTLTFDLVTPKSIGFLCYPAFRKVG